MRKPALTRSTVRALDLGPIKALLALIRPMALAHRSFGPEQLTLAGRTLK